MPVHIAGLDSFIWFFTAASEKKDPVRSTIGGPSFHTGGESSHLPRASRGGGILHVSQCVPLRKKRKGGWIARPYPQGGNTPRLGKNQLARFGPEVRKGKTRETKGAERPRRKRAARLGKVQHKTGGHEKEGTLHRQGGKPIKRKKGKARS